ncbi:MAG TPA: hypothetical protein VMW08_00820 [Acidimicrobiales bacterium]|nr:hypothetical protein [Acidimicrobiales bacterium]
MAATKSAKGRWSRHRDRCAGCDADIDATLCDATAAHYDGPFGTEIVAWTCSDDCCARFEDGR